jgi:teichuronic acid exporter
MSIMVFIMTYFIDNLVWQLFLGIVVGPLTYFFFCWLLKLEELVEIKELLSKLKKR